MEFLSLERVYQPRTGAKARITFEDHLNHQEWIKDLVESTDYLIEDTKKVLFTASGLKTLRKKIKLVMAQRSDSFHRSLYHSEAAIMDETHTKGLQRSHFASESQLLENFKTLLDVATVCHPKFDDYDIIELYKSVELNYKLYQKIFNDYADGSNKAIFNDKADDFEKATAFKALKDHYQRHSYQFPGRNPSPKEKYYSEVNAILGLCGIMLGMAFSPPLLALGLLSAGIGIFGHFYYQGSGYTRAQEEIFSAPKIACLSSGGSK